MNARPTPHSEQAEQIVIGCIALDGERAMDRLAEMCITADDFYTSHARRWFAAAHEMHRAGKPIDIALLREHILASGQIDLCGGARYVDQCVDLTPTATYLEHYAEALATKRKQRALIDAGNRLANDAHDCVDHNDTEMLRSRAELEIASLEKSGIGKRRESAEVIKAQLARWEAALHNGCAGLKTGFRMIDQVLGGLLDGGVYYVSGLAKSCKTTLVRQIVRNIAMRGVPCGVFSLEQTDEQMWGSLVAMKAGQSVFYLNSGTAHKVNLPAMHQAAVEVAKWPIYIDDRPHTLTTIWSEARRLVGRMGCRVLVLDYLQRIHQDRRYSGIEEFTTECSGVLTQIAKTMRVPVLVVSALSNEGRLRGSGMLAYDCFAHLQLEKQEGQNAVMVHFKSQRFGPEVKSETLTLDSTGNELVEDEYAHYGSRPHETAGDDGAAALDDYGR
jgi:replicative DNA helicase